jgi:hypothetical protein
VGLLLASVKRHLFTSILTGVAGAGLLAATAWNTPTLALAPSTENAAHNDDAGPCTSEGAQGTSAVPLASYRFLCTGGEWLLTSLDSARSTEPEGTITTDAGGNRFRSTDGVWVPQGVPNIPAIHVIS